MPLALALMIMANQLCPYSSLWLQVAQRLVTVFINLTPTRLCVRDFYQWASAVAANMLLVWSKLGYGAFG